MGLVFYLFVEAVDFPVVGINLRVQECIFFVGGVQLCAEVGVFLSTDVQFCLFLPNVLVDELEVPAELAASFAPEENAAQLQPSKH